MTRREIPLWKYAPYQLLRCVWSLGFYGARLSLSALKSSQRDLLSDQR